MIKRQIKLFQSLQLAKLIVNFTSKFDFEVFYWYIVYMIIKSAEYLTSVVSKDKILKDGVDFAFVGRSNVGKSSLINSLVGQKKLCKTSSMPGRTRMINYFNINKSFRFVDLPGYGYAKAGKEHKLVWASIMEEYLLNTQCLKRVFLLVDSRLEPTELDLRMLKFLFYYQIPTTVIATKCDKKLNLGKDNIIPYSSETNMGKNNILDVIENDLNNTNTEWHKHF